MLIVGSATNGEQDKGFLIINLSSRFQKVAQGLLKISVANPQVLI